MNAPPPSRENPTLTRGGSLLQRVTFGYMSIKRRDNRVQKGSLSWRIRTHSPMIQTTPTPCSLSRTLWLATGLMLAGITAHACQIKPVQAQGVRAPVEGVIVQAFTCKDAEGEHLFVESRQAGPSAQGKAAPAELSFYKFTTSGAAYIKRWQARDFAPTDERSASSARSARAPRTDRFIVRDVDGDGVVEAFISYTLPAQAPNPDDGKLLVYYKDRKFAIRGAVAQGPGDFGSRTLDAGFSVLPAPVQSYALSLWDSVALPKSLNATSGFNITQAPEH